MQYQLQSETVPEGAVDAFKSWFKNQAGELGVGNIVIEVGRSGTTLQVVVIYRNYKTFAQFNGLSTEDEDLEIVSYKSTENLFFFEHTQTFPNPWVTLRSDAASIDRTTEINNEILKLFTLSPNNETLYAFVFRSWVKRSDVTGAYKMEDHFTFFDYYVRGSGENVPEYITVFDRRANTPIWYVIGVGATLVFMAVAYVVFRATSRQRKKDVQTQTFNVQ